MTYELDEEDVAEIEAALRAAERALGRRRPSSRFRAEPPAAAREAVLAAVRELDARDPAAGMVPLPDLRAELRRRGLSARAAADAALLGLEDARAIDLLVAQSPGAVADRAAGIESPRGLLYYVALRRQDARR